jgi:hypothetical protein
MSEPCSKEAVLTTLQVRQAEIAGDVQHIKQKIDNGITHSIRRIDENLINLKPIIEHHADIVKRIEDFGWLISRTVTSAILAILAGLVIWAIGKGFLPKI